MRRRFADLVRPALCGALLLGWVLPLQAQSWKTVTMSRRISTERELDVRVTYGAGRFELGPADAGVLYRMQLRYDEEHFEPVSEYRDGRLRVGIDDTGGRINLSKGEDSGELTLRLAPDLPMDLRLECGAVKANVDLGGLSLSNLEFKTGASDTDLVVSELNPIRLGNASLKVGAAALRASRLGNLNADRMEIEAGVGDVTLEFTGQWQANARVEVNMGLGSLKLRFPRGLGVHLVRDTFLTSLDPKGLIKRGEDSYYSPDWEEAEHQVTVVVEAAFGSVVVDWVQ